MLNIQFIFFDFPIHWQIFFQDPATSIIETTVINKNVCLSTVFIFTKTWNKIENKYFNDNTSRTFFEIETPKLTNKLILTDDLLANITWRFDIFSTIFTKIRRFLFCCTLITFLLPSMGLDINAIVGLFFVILILNFRIVFFFWLSISTLIISGKALKCIFIIAAHTLKNIETPIKINEEDLDEIRKKIPINKNIHNYQRLKTIVEFSARSSWPFMKWDCGLLCIGYWVIDPVFESFRLPKPTKTSMDWIGGKVSTAFPTSILDPTNPLNKDRLPNINDDSQIEIKKENEILKKEKVTWDQKEKFYKETIETYKNKPNYTWSGWPWKK